MRIAVVGYGVRASIIEEAVDQGAEVVAVCDPSPAARARASARFPLARVVVRLEDLPMDDVDAAFVLSPDRFHEEQTVTLLNAGVACYVEKPLAITIDGCDRILRVARDTGTPLYAGHNLRHMPVIRTLREVVASGLIGEVTSIWCRHFVGNGGDYYFRDWHADRRNVTSLLLQKGAHDLDVIHWLAGGYSRQVSAFGDLRVYGSLPRRTDTGDDALMTEWLDPTRNWPPTTLTGLHSTVDVEDVSVMNMRLDNGVIATYQQCHYTPDYWRNYTIIGTEGRAENFGDQAGAVVRVWNRRHDYDPAGDVVIRVPDEPGGHGGADARIVREFFGLLDGGTSLTVRPTDAREAVAAGYAATQSLRAGGTLVSVPPPQLDPDSADRVGTGSRADSDADAVEHADR